MLRKKPQKRVIMAFFFPESISLQRHLPALHTMVNFTFFGRGKRGSKGGL